MLIVLFLVCAFLVLCSLYILSSMNEGEVFATVLIALSGFCGAVIVIIYVCLIGVFPYNIDKKLAMYEEENIKIEEKVKNLVKVYIDYEKEFYSDLVNEDMDLETLLIAYPDLNSNTLVASEIQVYVENNNKIKELKEQQITRSTMAWWLYFGN